MKIRTLAQPFLAVLAICLLSAAVPAAEAEEAAALRAARAWLTVVDGGDYDGSWQEAAKYFQTAVNRQQWSQTLGGVRQSFGNVLTRELMSATYATELPGAPDGDYVVIQFATTFENKRSAVETVTPMLEDDGSWLVAGYFIR